MRHIISPLCILFLTGCASTGSPQTCSLDTWQALGASTAMSGGLISDYESVSSCGTSAPVAFKTGFEQGLEKTCTFENGLFTGEHGKTPVKSCSDSSWGQYQEGFLTGREMYSSSQRLEVIASRLALTRKHLSALQSNHATGTLAAVDHKRITVLRGDIAALVSERDTETRRLSTLQLTYKNNYKKIMTSL